MGRWKKVHPANWDLIIMVSLLVFAFLAGGTLLILEAYTRASTILFEL